MLIIVLVNIDRRHGDPWEGHLSVGIHNASVRFADPGSGDLATAQVSLASCAIVNAEEL